MYRQLTVIVNGPPDPSEAPTNMLSDVKTVSLTSGMEDNHSSGLNVADPKDDTVQQALGQCNDNSACTLALLHKKELKIPGDYWVCHALTAGWQAKPLGMMLLIAGQQIRNNSLVAPHPNITCSDSYSTPTTMAFEVPLQHTKTCVFSTSSSGPYLGQSSCQTRIFVKTKTPTNCSHSGTNNTLTRFACPFRQLSSQPAVQLLGCCHPSIVATDTKVFHKKAPVTNIQSTTHF